MISQPGVDLTENQLSSILSKNLKLLVNVFTFTDTIGGGDWNSSLNWSPAGVPGAGDFARIAAGTYTVTSNENNSVYAVRIGAGATLEIGDGTIFAAIGATNAGKITVDDGAALLLGNIFNSGIVLANGTDSLVDFVGLVSGGITKIKNGIIDIQQASSENVTFKSGGIGGLELENAGGYTGKVSGFGTNTAQFIDFIGVNSSSATVAYIPNAANPTGAPSAAEDLTATNMSVASQRRACTGEPERRRQTPQVRPPSPE